MQVSKWKFNPILLYKRLYFQVILTQTRHGRCWLGPMQYRLRSPWTQMGICQSGSHFEEFQYQTRSNLWYFQHKHLTRTISLESSSLKNLQWFHHFYSVLKVPIPEQNESITCPFLNTRDCVDIRASLLHELWSPSSQNSVLNLFFHKLIS